MAYFKNWPISKLDYYKNWPIFKIDLFQKLAYFKNWPISKINQFQKLTYFKKIDSFKNWPILKFRRRHNYRKRGVFFSKKATIIGNPLSKKVVFGALGGSILELEFII